MILSWEPADDDQVAELWNELVTWTTWLARCYPRVRATLQPCWPEHPEVIRELVAYMTWWQNIYFPPARLDPNGDKLGRDDDGHEAVLWHAELEAFCHRLHAALKGCTTAQCWRRSEYGNFEGSQLPAPNLPDPAATTRLWEAPH